MYTQVTYPKKRKKRGIVFPNLSHRKNNKITMKKNLVGSLFDGVGHPTLTPLSS